jgi:3-deoxy-D-manno-octulosonate 8-phosphate phosphatase (KDO 8-P phosphatase)
MLRKLRTDLTSKLHSIRLFLISADIFLTERQVSHERALSSNNGHEVKALKKLGVSTAAFSNKSSEAVDSIVSRLGIELLHQGVSQKTLIYSKLKTIHSTKDSEIAFIGGDASDFPIIERVNFPVAAADAPLEVKAKCYYVTYGVGEEAVREVAELILRAKNGSNGWSD